MNLNFTLFLFSLSLSYLNLSSTELSCLEFGPEFAGFASLKTLVLQDNPISQVSEKIFII